jgi:hypothetical protein
VLIASVLFPRFLLVTVTIWASVFVSGIGVLPWVLSALLVTAELPGLVLGSQSSMAFPRVCDIYVLRRNAVHHHIKLLLRRREKHRSID